MSEFHPAARHNTEILLELIEDGILDKDMVIRACLLWMSDRDVGEMSVKNAFFPYSENESE